jgi:hypothetical protein
LIRADLAGLLALGAAACLSARPAPAPGPRFVFVRPGAVDGDGSRERPFAQLDQALASGAPRIRLLPGRHAAPAVPITHSVGLFGEPGARVAGRLEVSGAEVTVAGLWLEAGLELRTGRADVRTSTLGAGGEDDALNAYRARVELDGVRIRPGARAGVYVLGATLTLARSDIAGATRRSLVGKASRVELTALRIEGASHAHGVCLNCRARLRGVHTGDSARVGWVFKDSVVHVRGGALQGERHALLATGSQVMLREGRVGGGRVFALGANSSTVSLCRVQVEAAGGGLSGATGSRLEIQSSTIAFAEADGITMSGGALRLDEVRLRGGASSRDGLVLHGAHTGAVIRRSRVAGTSGWAMVSTADAKLWVDSSTIGPSGGGVWVQDGFRGNSQLRRSRIRGCFGEAGLRFDGAWVRTSSISFDDCPVVGARRGELQAEGGRFGAGIHLFGASRAALTGGRVRGRPWAAFCGKGGELVLDATTVEGPSPGCRLPPSIPAPGKEAP